MIVVSAAAAIVLLVIIEALVVLAGNKANAAKTADMLTNQVVGVMAQNEQDEQTLLTSLKEDYIVRAQAIAYILSYNSAAENDVRELGRIAVLLSVDEIHVFDENGTIISGTMPKYFGLTLDSGEQISYFKPMLENKNLTMCQDVTPNTAEEKSMMYAMVWNNDGTRMIQVGIEPVHMLEELRKNSISEVVDSMPMPDGVEIFVSDKTSGIVLGSTDKNTVEQTLDSLGMKNSTDGSYYTANVGGKRQYCSVREYNDYTIVITQSFASVNHGMGLSMAVLLVYLCVAAVVALTVFSKLTHSFKNERESRLKEQEQAVAQLKHQMSIIEAVSKEFTDVIVIDAVKARAAMIKVGSKMIYRTLSDKSWKPYEETWHSHIEQFVLGEDAARVAESVKLEKVLKALEQSEEYVLSYRMSYKGAIYYYKVKFVKLDADYDGQSIVASFQNVNAIVEAEHEKLQLEHKANRDELTGLLNRNSYEEALHTYQVIPAAVDVAFIALDVNGLKNINDSLGHGAGDELIKGAASCMLKAFGEKGKVYRTGGDEFFAMIFADEDSVNECFERLRLELNSWSGQSVKEISVAYGSSSNREFPNMTASELAKIADARMYKDKQRYYSQRGIDGRGQQAAFRTICESYILVLKVNLTEDIFHPIHADLGRLDTAGKTFSESMKVYSQSDMIADEDKASFMEQMKLENLRSFFEQGGSVFRLYFRGKAHGEYRRVMLEMTPAAEYSDANRTVFLYIKDIDSDSAENLAPVTTGV